VLKDGTFKHQDKF